MFFAYKRTIFSDLWGLVGRRMLHPQRGGFICERFASLKMPPLSLFCWHCYPDNEDEGWYHWQHTEAGMDQLIILQEPNTNTGSAKYFCDAIKKTFSASKQLARVGFKQVPCCKVRLAFQKIFNLFNFEYLFWNMTNDSYSEMFYCSGPILRD